MTCNNKNVHHTIQIWCLKNYKTLTLFWISMKVPPFERARIESFGIFFLFFEKVKSFRSKLGKYDFSNLENRWFLMFFAFWRSIYKEKNSWCWAFFLTFWPQNTSNMQFFLNFFYQLYNLIITFRMRHHRMSVVLYLHSYGCFKRRSC